MLLWKILNVSSGTMRSLGRSGLKLCCSVFFLATKMPRLVLPRLLLGSTKKHRLERRLKYYCSGFIVDRGWWSRPLFHSSPHCIFPDWSSATLCCLCSDFCLFCPLLRLTADPVFALSFCTDSACFWLCLSWCFLTFIGISYKINKFMGLTKF